MGNATETAVRKIVHQTAALLDRDSAQMRVDVRRGFVGEAYGVPTAECVEAIKLLARLEGMVLDPVYEGKALAGLIDLARGELGKKRRVPSFGRTQAVHAYAPFYKQ